MTTTQPVSVVEALRDIQAPFERPHEGKYGGARLIKMLNDNRDIARAALPIAEHQEEVMAKMLEALNTISSQAVCVNMDGAAGNERMLVHIYELSEAAILAAKEVKP